MTAAVPWPRWHGPARDEIALRAYAMLWALSEECMHMSTSKWSKADATVVVVFSPQGRVQSAVRNRTGHPVEELEAGSQRRRETVLSWLGETEENNDA